MMKQKELRKNNNVGAGIAFGKSKKLIVNNEEYKCFAFDVGAGLVSVQKIKKQNAITLIALIITIIVMLILVGVVLNLTLGEHGIFKTAKDATSKYSEQEAREKLELVLFNMQAEKVTNSEYNENEYLTKKIEENGMKVNENIVTVGSYKFEIDRSVPRIAGNVEKDENKEIVKTGLVAWYDGIENAGTEHSYDATSWKDLTGNNVQGATINGATWTKDGLYFDGSNDWVNMNSILMPEESNFTIDVVMYQSVYHSNAFVFAQNSSSSTAVGRTGIDIYDGKIQFDTYYSGSDYISTTSEYAPKLTQKIDVAIVRNGDKFEIWVNGEKKVEQALEKETKIYQGNTILGKWGLENYGHFNGVIHSVKAYDEALTKEQIEQNYKANNERFNIEEKIGSAQIVKQGLTAWYDGIENTETGHSYDATTWKDLTGKNVQGATINGASWTPNGLYFDGNYVDMNSILMPEEENFTIDMVFSQNSSASNYVFAQSNKNANGRTGIAAADSNNGIHLHSLSSQDYMVMESGYIPKLTEKVDISIIKNANKFEVWINGQKMQEQENTYGKILQVNTILGKWGLENLYYMHGIIYSVKAYDRALNSGEIEQNYNANKLRFNM